MVDGEGMDFPTAPNPNIVSGPMNDEGFTIYGDDDDEHPYYDEDDGYEDDDVPSNFRHLDDESKEKMARKIKSEYACFVEEGTDYMPTKKTVTSIPCGYYKIRKEYGKGIYLRKQPVNLSKLVVLENCPIHQKLINAIVHFWESKEEYLKRGKIYKRNILLYSAPGMGKTSLINLVVDDLIRNRDGFVISLSESSDILNFNEMMLYVRAIMPERPIIVIIEDFDNFCGSKGNKEVESELLNILDGNQKYDNLVIIATTNYHETLDDRYINRPSRFNMLLEYEYPNAKLRKEFLEKTNLKEDLESVDLDYIVERTEGFTIDYLNELSMSLFINKEPLEDALAALSQMMKTNMIKYNKPGHKKIGMING